MLPWLESLRFALSYHAVRLDIGVEALGLESWGGFIDSLPLWVVGIHYLMWICLPATLIMLWRRHASAIWLYGIALMVRVLLFLRSNLEFEFVIDSSVLWTDTLPIGVHAAGLALIFTLWTRGGLPNGWPRWPGVV